jgi:N-acetylmuramoyl-L-alanine amidase
MKVFLNAGHSPNGNPDPGAVNQALNLRECDIAKTITDRVAGYLAAAGVQVVGNVQSDDLVGDVVDAANDSGADIFVSIHCNSFANPNAQGTEVCVYPGSSVGRALGGFIQRQIVDSLDTVDRGLKDRDGLYVLRCTDMPAVLVETAFISNGEDASKLRDNADDFARAIARGITDYVCSISVSDK